MAPIDVSELLARIPAQPLAAKLILRLVEDPDASTAQLARLVEMDPALSARVMRLANSPHYGVRAGVHSAARAVILLGVSTVRGLAAAAATTLLVEDVDLGPVDYWTHTVSVAAAASVAGNVLGVPENESFTAGLLHDIGTSLFHRADPTGYDAMVGGLVSGGPGLASAELATYGLTHPEAGALALEEWHFPKSFVRAIRTHHDPVASISPLAQTIVLGEALADEVEPLGLAEPVPSLVGILSALGVPTNRRLELLARTRSAIATVGEFFGDVA
jgi:putative nucleotidyltransferase with HDIG domain